MTRPGDTFASLLGETAWDYSPEDAGVGLLSPISRYFLGFPWEGRQRGEERSVSSPDEDDLVAVDTTGDD